MWCVNYKVIDRYRMAHSWHGQRTMLCFANAIASLCCCVYRWLWPESKMGVWKYRIHDKKFKFLSGAFASAAYNPNKGAKVYLIGISSDIVMEDL